MLLIKLDSFIYINYDLTAVLHDRILENPVLVLLGGVESYAKELAYSLETIYIFVCSGWLLLLGSFGTCALLMAIGLFAGCRYSFSEKGIGAAEA